MWHEARKHEKKIRVMIVDYRKRAERRREFYEKFKADPTQFMQVHGRPIKIYMDPQITAAAEKCLMPWPGNPETTIDRFDVRAHLDHIPDPHSYSREEVKDDTEQPGLNYERYRILIQNDLAGIAEDKFLHQIHIEEQYGTTVPLSGHKADTKPKQQKAAIAYTYEDSTPNASSVSAALTKASGEIAGAADEDSDEDLDFDLLVNVNDMTMAQKADLNNSGMKYGLAPGDFMKFLNTEIQEKEDIRLAKLQEEEKQAMSGRKARRERRAFKDRIILRKGISSPPSYAASNTPASDRSHHSSSRSRSKSNSPEKIEYITSFGEIKSQETNKRLQAGSSTIGPNLPPIRFPTKLRKRSISRSPAPQSRNLRSLSKSPLRASNRIIARHSRTSSDSSSSVSSHSSHDGKPDRKYTARSSSSSGSRSRSRTRGRSRSRSRSYGRRRSRSSSSRRRYLRRSTSRRRSRSRSRSKSRREREQHESRKRHGSRNSRSKSRSKPPSKRRYESRSSDEYRYSDRKRDSRRSKSKTNSRSGSPVASSSSRSSNTTPVKLPSPPVKRYYGREKPTTKANHSSASPSSSDSEADTKVSSCKTVNKSDWSSHSGGKSKSSVSSSAKVQSAGESLKSGQGVKPQDRLKRRMQTALNRQLKADKEAQKSRLERQELERMEREDTLRELSLKYRRRERERRHRNHTGDSRSRSTSTCGSSRSGSSVSDRSKSPCLEF